MHKAISTTLSSCLPGDGAHGVASAEGCVSAGRKILLLLHYLRTDPVPWP
ncbi:ATP-dependent DNA helicase, partial [Fusarium oxysporum f. sp. albedinis]